VASVNSVGELGERDSSSSVHSCVRIMTRLAVTMAFHVALINSVTKR